MTRCKPPDTEIGFSSNVGFQGLSFKQASQQGLLYFHNEESTKPNVNLVRYQQKTSRADAHKIMRQKTHKAQNTAVFVPTLF